MTECEYYSDDGDLAAGPCVDCGADADLCLSCLKCCRCAPRCADEDVCDECALAHDFEPDYEAAAEDRWA